MYSVLKVHFQYIAQLVLFGDFYAVDVTKAFKNALWHHCNTILLLTMNIHITWCPSSCTMILGWSRGWDFTHSIDSTGEGLNCPFYCLCSQLVNCRCLHMYVLLRTVTLCHIAKLSGISCIMAFTAQATLHVAKAGRIKGMSPLLMISQLHQTTSNVSVLGRALDLSSRPLYKIMVRVCMCGVLSP